MSKARLIMTAVVLEGRTQVDIARTYDVWESSVPKLIARYRAEGDTAFEPKSRRPKTLPTAVRTVTVELNLQLRRNLSAAGLDAGPDTIG